MRNLKKFLALVLAMIMVVSAAAVVSADFTDVTADNQYAEAINDLAVKKVIVGTTDTTFSPDADVQRYQMALLVARATTGIVDNEDWANGVKIFDDVTADHFKGAISYAYVNGIIRGRDAKTFDPAGNIAYIDALTMAVRALGFNDLEYPMGYFKKAADLGLTENVAVYELDATLDRAETAQIIYNMIYVVRENGLTMAAEYFDRVVVRTSDLFVISCTPKQTYAVEYEASTNKDETFVGIQPLVNGIPNGEVMYLTTAQLGIEKADVEKYFNYAVELINYDAKTGKFDEVKLGDAPDLYRNKDVTINADMTIKVGTKTYDAVAALSGNVRKNEFVAIAGDNFEATPAKMLLEDDNGQVWSKEGKVVAQRIPFSGETIKYYASFEAITVDGEPYPAGSIVNEAVALAAWGFATNKVEYAQYATLDSDAIKKLGAYQLQCFDDNKDGTYDRVFANKVYMSVYNTNTDGTVVYDVVTPNSEKTVAELTFTDPSVKVKGTVYVYTYNSMAKIVNVIETVEAQKGTLSLIDATKINETEAGKKNYKVQLTIDGTKYLAAFVDSPIAAQDLTIDDATIGAEVIDNPTLGSASATYENIAKEGYFARTNVFSFINKAYPGMKVNFYTYGAYENNPIILFVEEAKPAATTDPAKSMVVMGGGDVDVDARVENILTKLYVNGILTDAKIESIKGDVFADLSILKQTALLGNADLYYPGLIYKTTVNDDGEFALLDIANFDPYTESVYKDIYGFKLVPDATKDGDDIKFKSGVTTAPGYANKIFTDKDTVFYFIDRTANDDGGAALTVDGEDTVVSTFIGGPVNASITYNDDTRVFVDKLGTDGFADVVIVYDADALSGFGYTTVASSVVYVPKALENATAVGTAAALGLTDSKYAESNYYMYVNAAIDLQTGAKATIITTEKLTNDNSDMIYKLDANGVVIEEATAKGEPLAGRTSTLFMSIAEAVDLGVLAKVETAVLKYVPEYGFTELHVLNGVEILGHEDAINNAIIFKLGDAVTDANILKNEKADKIVGTQTAYYLATGLTDRSIVVLYQ